MFSALVQYFLFPQYSEKAGKLQHMCNKPISLYNTQACVISALHRSPWGSTQNHTLSVLLHNQQCLFLLDLFLLSHHSPLLSSTSQFCSLTSHSILLMLTGTIIFGGLPAGFTQILSDCQGITGKCWMYFSKQARITIGHISFKLGQVAVICFFFPFRKKL